MPTAPTVTQTDVTVTHRRRGKPSRRRTGDVGAWPRKGRAGSPAQRVSPSLRDPLGRWRRRARERGENGMATADLVLEGGGVKGIGLVGAISVLEERGYTFHRIAGTSAGAIVGSLVAAGIPCRELQDIMWKVDYNRFQDASVFGRLGPVGKGIDILFRDGIYKGQYLLDWLTEQLAGVGKHTFADLRLDDPGASP